LILIHDTSNFFVSTMSFGYTMQVWYPGGSLKGDDRSKALVESWRDNTLMLKDQYKGSLDGKKFDENYDYKILFYDKLFSI
jgi:hypothetical protein